MSVKNFSEISPKIFALSEKCMQNGAIDKTLYEKHHVNRG